MICPKCHNDNKYDNLTCDFCMAPLPMTKEREKEIEQKKKLEQKEKYRKSMDKLIGLSIGLVIIILIVVMGIWVF